MLFILSYIILVSDTHFITGLFIYFHVFAALSFIASDKGISKDNYRYAEVFIKNKDKTEFGRIMKITGDSLELLKRKKNKTFLAIIPMRNIEKFELRTLKEIELLEEQEK